MLSYVVPLRRFRLEPIEELTGYLYGLASVVEVLVIDGSDPCIFEAHRRSLAPCIRHLPVTVHAGLSGKVNGVLTGLAAASYDVVAVADDDVRWTPQQLERAEALLLHADLVRPQNHFAPLPWHARWDTARTLFNRAIGEDYPGTLVVRRTVLTATGGYDADVLFENLELIRTVRAAGGRVRNAPDLYVRRLPPSTRHFLGQRVRQAYDSSAQPLRLVAELALLPVAITALRRGRIRAVATAAAATVALAEGGRRRAGGRAVFPASSSALAPLWLSERAVCAWLAVLQRLRGGVPYAGQRFVRAGSTRRQLRRRPLNGGRVPTALNDAFSVDR